MHSSMTSSSNNDFQGTDDIFLSFNGGVTGKKFTDDLSEALEREGFKIRRGVYKIGWVVSESELQEAIRNSRMSVIVFSEHYIYSRAGLFEIQTILEHHKKSDHLILPVFYELDPGDILGRFSKTKNLHSGRNKVKVEEDGWSAALQEVVSMNRMACELYGYEAKFIEEIVGVLKSKLASKHLRVADHLELDKNTHSLKRKFECLSGQENDINAKISSAERQPRKRQKKEVEVWLRDVERLREEYVQQLKDDLQMFEEEVVDESNVFVEKIQEVVELQEKGRVSDGLMIVEKIQEVVELQEKGRVSDGLMIDELPSGRLLLSPTKYFVESTKATETIWECLMDDDIRQIGIYGIGGIGKTTIMKHIHNQLLEEKGKFDMVYWVSASKAFDVRKLQRDIAKALNLSISDDEDVLVRASEVNAALFRRKKYVLILDDLWEAIPLEMVGIPKPTRSNGCKIVLTTRSLDVCRRMDCTAVKVELLTKQEALTLFLRTATSNDMVLAPEEEVIAAEIAKECACLPLAIVTVAGSLRGLRGIREWRNALVELISLTKDVDNGEREVFERLKFSYNHLGDEVLQDCFLYCSLYPKNHYIPVKELIEYWIAEGLIAEMNSVREKFEKGHAILGKLTSSCLLESFTDEAGEEWLSMHDLVRDMALRMTISRPRFMVKAGERLESVPYGDWSKDLDKISFMHSQIGELPIRPPVCPRLTTLLLSYVHVSEIPGSFFSEMHCLKVLDLSGNKIRRLPESISNLKKLHALILVGCKELTYVPSLEELKALKVFILTQSLIEEVPEGTEALVNLIKLDLSNNKRLKRSPEWTFRGLQKLQYLGIDGTRVKVTASDLQCLRHLKVVAASFYHLHELRWYVSSPQCKGLEKYRLSMGERFSERKLVGKDVCIKTSFDLTERVVNQLVLPVNIDFFQLHGMDDHVSLSDIRALKDARNLRRCDVSCCGGLESIFSSSSFSEDGQISLQNVESLFLSYLPSCRVLFDGYPWGIYFNLKELCFRKCDTMKNIFPVQLLKNFPNLGLLVVSECANVEDIIVEEKKSYCGKHQDDSNTISLPKLQILYLAGLPRLKSIYCGVMVCQSIEDVCVHNCPHVRRLPLSLHMHGEQATAPPFLKCIEVEEIWWQRLQWDDPHTKTILQPFVNRGFQTRYEVSHSSEEELLEDISLEKMKETPSDPQELEDLNFDPTEVPSTLSHHFSILHELDLSYTEMKSLPQSISRLVALQKLVLRNCKRLMELPPGIGELTNLEVLDLEGTEILFLPKEIAKLVNLTCLKVSFYGHVNQTVIPRRVLSNLSRLNELTIDVTPCGEWWDVEVEAIIDDLCSLKELRTLKLYLPTAELLEKLTLIFPGLTNFRFTVGRYEEHFISRLRHDAEEEFNNAEKLEKCLKYINGSHIPNEITKVIKHADAFFLQRHWTAESLSEFRHENMNELKFFLVMECNEFRTIIDSELFYQGKDGRGETEDLQDLDESIVLGSLERLIIRYMKNMVSFWKGPVGKGSLTNLKFLSLHTCPNLTTLFTIDMLSNLRNLEELIVEDCPKIDSLVSPKSSGSKSDLFLPSLKKISLLELPELVSIASGLCIAPKLERMVIFYCPKLEKLSAMDVSSRNLKVIKGEKEWWDALKWYESDLSTKHEDYLTSRFIPLRRNGDLFAQSTKD